MKMRLQNLIREFRLRRMTLGAVALISMFAFASCAKDQTFVEPNNGEATVTLQLKTPYFAQPTRSIGDASQNAILTLDVLAFRIDGDGTNDNDPEHFDYHAPTYKDGAQHKAKVVVKSYPQRFVVIANAGTEVKALVESFRGSGADRETVMQKLVMSLAADAKWNATDDSDYQPLPMYGESGAITVTAAIPTIGTILMVRMHSKIEVSLKDELFNTNKFQLRSIHLYNTNTSGRVSPIIDATGTYFNRAGNVAVAPSLPLTVAANSNPLVYIAASTEGKAMRGGIFTFEALAATAATPERQPSIVVGGVFEQEKDGSNNEVVTYYRVDFVDGTKKYIPLLRNHTYSVNVMDVSRRGFNTPAEAFDAGPINIDAAIVAWDNGMWEEVADDGQFKMAVSHKVYTHSKEASTGKLTISTNWTSGLESVKFSADPVNADAGGAGWLTQTSLTDDGAPSGLRTYELLFRATQNDGTLRTGYIHLLAGRMHMVVRVEQSDKLEATIWITDEDGITPIENFNFFAAEGAQPDAKKYKIHWSPAASKVTINVAAMGYDPILWESSALSPDRVTVMDDGSGMAEFTVQPKAILTAEMGSDAFYERQAMVSYHIVYAGQSIVKMLPMRHYVKNIRLEPESFYLMDAEKKSVTVKSNVPWKLMVRKNTSSSGKRVVSDINGVTIDHIASGGDIEVASGDNNLPEGDVVRFTTVDDLINVTPSIFSGDFELEVVAENSDANPDDKVLLCASGIRQPLSNTYLVAPNSIPILIPVKRANGYGINNGVEFRQADWATLMGANATPIGSLTDYTADLVWTDTPHSKTAPVKSIGDNGAVKMVVKAGSNADGYILVMPGATPGNAVVAVTVGKDAERKIVWSWHIWVVKDYNPDPAVDIWMDRNLGATTNTPSTASNPTITSTLGLYYQWGRKDPIPGAGSVSANIGSTYYLSDNTSTSHVPTWLSGAGSLLESVQDPLRSYDAWTGSNGDASWITGYKNVYDTGDKTIYDPCPDGWRVPVRINKSNTESTHHWGNEGTTNIGNKWDGSYGINWPAKGGYYPAAGNRYSDGLRNVGVYGYCWSASSTSSFDYILYFTIGYVYPSYNYSRNLGFSVRCVTEQP